MATSTLAQNLKAALGAGALAGMLVALYHFLATEPVLQEAIGREAALGPVQEVFPRSVQRLGLFGGFLLYGLSWGLIFAGSYSLLERHLPGRAPWQRGLALALGLMWSVAIFPFLKFPANPPGVGDEATVEARQAGYLLFTVLSAAALLVAWRLARGGSPRRLALALGLYAVACLLLYFMVPKPHDEVPAGLSDLLPRFRALSAGGLALFWLVVGGGFGPLHVAFAPDGQTARGHPAGPR
ncbi:MAG TPA: CbtA family protein [Dehalococcoidia bacterium]|nr:CbtA family protein [Dehalococcoidia bacterium]